MSTSLACIGGAGGLFLATHLIPSIPGLRDTLVRISSERIYLGLYVAVSLATFGLFAYSYAAAESVDLWGTALWSRLVPLVVMPFALILVVVGYTTKNPTAVMHADAVKAADPAPGMLKITRHPLMWGAALFAASHIPGNGDGASVIFFGVVAGLALIGMPLMDARKRRRLGADWERFAGATSALPFAALLAGRTNLRWSEIGWWRVGVGLGLYVGFLFAHGPVLGISALPG